MPQNIRVINQGASRVKVDTPSQSIVRLNDGAHPISYGQMNVSGNIATATISGDLFNFSAGNNIVLVLNTTTKTLTISSTASGGNSDQANLAFNQANNAYNQANIAFIIANDAFTLANVEANLSFTTVNVSGTLVKARSNSDVLTLGAGNYVTFTSNTVNNSIVITVDISAAFNQANNSNITAISAFTKANIACTQSDQAGTNANNAYGFANTLPATIATAYAAANTASDRANTAYNQANTVSNRANTANLTANNALVTSQGAFLQANTACTQSDTAGTNANTAYGQANTAYNQANSAMSQGNNAFKSVQYISSNGTTQVDATQLTGNVVLYTIQTSNVQNSGVRLPVTSLVAAGANKVYVIDWLRNQTTNNVIVYPPANGSIDFLTANTGITLYPGETISLYANSVNTWVSQRGVNVAWISAISDQANNAYTQANAAFNQANAAFVNSNTANLTANNALITAQGAFLQANNDNTTAASAFTKANTACTQSDQAGTNANNAYGFANTLPATIATAYAQANTAYNAANTAENNANTAILAAFTQANVSLNMSKALMHGILGGMI